MAIFTLTNAVNDFTGTTEGDTFTGQAGGVDTLNGGGGDDYFEFEQGQSGQVIGGAGTDRLRAPSLMNLAISGVEVLDVATTTARLAQLAQFTSITDSFTPAAKIVLNVEGPGGTIDFGGRLAPGYSIEFNSLASSAVNVTAGAAGDTLIGSSWNDTLRGADGNDSLAGGFGSNVLHGGGGDDTIASRGDDTVSGGSGNDTIWKDPGSSLSLDAGDGDDYIGIALTGFQEGPITGAINGGSGHDTIAASQLIQIPLDLSGISISRVEDLDTYQVKATLAQLNSFSSIMNSALPDSRITIIISGDGGSFSAPAKLAGGHALYFAAVEAGSGVRVTGTNLADEFLGTAFDDVINGGDGNDRMSAFAGNDTMRGGGGEDTIYVGRYTTGGEIGAGTILALGGDGNDRFIPSVAANALNTGTVDGGGGSDTVLGGHLNDLIFTSVETLQAEAVTAKITQLLSFKSITSGGPDGRIQITIAGAGGALDLSTRVASAYSVDIHGSQAASGLSLTGTARADRLQGSAFADELVGGGGNDTLLGGDGDDVYRVAGNDTILENTGQGRDRVETATSFSLAAIENLEDLTLTGQGHLSGTGNSAANAILGNAGNNALAGGEGADSLNGGAGNDTLTGGSDHDILAGGKGNDLYVDPDSDAIVEGAGDGIDTIQTGITFTLAQLPGVERLVLTGAGDVDGTGNALDNVLTGNGGANLLRGGAGNDLLRGGSGNDRLVGNAGADRLFGEAGSDIFLFNGAADSTGTVFDTIINANLNSDSFDLPNSVGAVATRVNGRLESGSFSDDIAAAVDGSLGAGGPKEAILFDPSSGDLDQPGHVFLVVDLDNDGAYVAGSDLLIELINATGTLSPSDFI